MTPLTLAILAYVIAQFALGALVSRNVKTEQDYLIAGRRLGPVVIGFSVFATWFGAESCVGAAGQVYAEGLGSLSVEPFAYGLALLLVGLFVAAPLWRTGVTTFPDLLRTRYSPGVERLTALLHVPGSVLWAAAQVRAFGQVLSAAGDVDLSVAISIAAILAIAYTAMGGMLADVVTDVLQGGVLVIGLIVVAVALVLDVGGLQSALELAKSRPPAASPATIDVFEAWLVPIGGSIVSQELLSRTLAARSGGASRAGTLAGGGAYLLVGCIPVFLGLVGFELLPGLEDAESILPTLAKDRLHPAVFVIFVGALVSAILSTVDSALLVAGSLWSRNIRPAGDVPDAQKLRRARTAVAVFGVLAWGIALLADGVSDLVEQASGFGSAGMLVVLMLGLFTKRGSARAAMAALVTGISTWIVARYILQDFAYPYLVGVTLSAAAYGAVWLADRWRAQAT